MVTRDQIREYAMKCRRLATLMDRIERRAHKEKTSVEDVKLPDGTTLDGVRSELKKLSEDLSV